VESSSLEIDEKRDEHNCTGKQHQLFPLLLAPSDVRHAFGERDNPLRRVRGVERDVLNAFENSERLLRQSWVQQGEHKLARGARNTNFLLNVGGVVTAWRKENYDKVAASDGIDNLVRQPKSRLVFVFSAVEIDAESRQVSPDRLGDLFVGLGVTEKTSTA
jgi:hypothetical protein